MAFAHAQNINVPNSTFNEVGRDQYFQISNYDNVDPSAQGLLQLQPSPMDYSTRMECLPETRVDLLRSIEDWTNNTSVKQSVLVLYGLAGAGKSTLSTTFANRCRNTGRLGAFLFFNRDVVQRNDPKPIIRTIAYQIAFFDRRIEAAVSTAVKSTPNVCFLTPRVQFRKLVVEPLLSVRQQGPLSGKLLGKLLPRKNPKPVAVVVLDALDECGDPISRKNLLEILAEETATLAPIVRFVITSRAESDICSHFASRSHIAVRQLDTTTQSNAADIQRYLRHRAKITVQRNRHLQLRADWPGVDVIQKLVDQAGGLFVWATTAWAFIDTAYYPQKHLDMLLKGQVPRMAEATLDNLYSTALESVGNWDSEDFVKDFRMILGAIIAAKDPLSSTAIDQLLEMPPEQPSMHTISRLACVLSQGPAVRVLHPSFADFLCTQTRCGRDIWFIDPIVQNRALAIQCLSLLDGALTMNSRNLTLSADIETEALPEGVTYACVFWIDHICRIEEDIPPVLEHLTTFLNTHLLHWFEVMSILKRSRDTILLLNKLSTWITINAPDQTSLHELVHDSCRFAQTFANSVEKHPLLVYFGALPFAPLTSAIYQKFHNNTHFPSIIGGFEKSWSPLLLTFVAHGGPVTSAVFSPDGTRIISGSHDKTVRVLDVQSGVEVVPTMHGHQGFVLSISCSPDGTRIASSSDDMTICVWDASSGTEIVRGMHGHTDWILTVAFSCDGTRIVSGSRDNTIRIWDVLSGVELVPAMYGHQDSVYSAVFSPDDTRIASSSRDNTIRVWDALTGKEILPAICGHEGIVFSVAFSPDGTRIVSGSQDSTVRVWDASLGTEIVRAQCGHEDWVLSVAFSPDGRRIVSGSLKNTVRIWDASSGIEVVPKMRSHQGIVLSVAFSPDGTYVVSGSQDNTVRVWAATSRTDVVPATHEQILPDTSLSVDPRVVIRSSDVEDKLPDGKGVTATPHLQEERGIFQVAVSPDGTRVVSGSMDNTIRVWDALSGAEIVAAVHDHQDLFFSVMFSPDGTRVIARSSDGTDLGWDAASGMQLFDVASDHTTLSTPRISSRTIEVNSDGWLVHVPTNRTISKLPAVITPLCSASHGTLLAIGTQGGQVIIMTFPSVVFTRSETRPTPGKGRQRRELQYDSLDE